MKTLPARNALRHVIQEISGSVRIVMLKIPLMIISAQTVRRQNYALNAVIVYPRMTNIAPIVQPRSENGNVGNVVNFMI